MRSGTAALIALGAVGGGSLLAVVIYRWLTKEDELSPEETSLPAEPAAPVLPSSAPPDLDLITVPTQPAYRLRRDVAMAFLQMEAAAKAEGIELPISTAYRSYEWQVQLYASWTAYKAFTEGKGPPAPWAPLAAKPGKSNHQKGIAIDFHGIDPSKAGINYFPERAQWLMKNAASFNFYNSVPSEPWHYAFGVEREGLLHDATS